MHTVTAHRGRAFKAYFANITTWGPKAMACTKEICKEFDAIMYAETHLKEEKGATVQRALNELGLRGQQGDARQSDRSEVGSFGGSCNSLRSTSPPS